MAGFEKVILKDHTQPVLLAVLAHPDDETFTSGGLLAMLAAAGNNVQILIYTNDNAGSNPSVDCPASASRCNVRAASIASP